MNRSEKSASLKKHIIFISKIKKMYKIKPFLISVIILLNFSVNAQIVTERPTQSESALVLPVNSFQIESGMIYQKTGEDMFSDAGFTAPVTLFRYGIAKFIELRLITSYQKNIIGYHYSTPYKISGFNDIEVGTKIQIFKSDNSNTDIAFVTHLSIPTGSPMFTNNDYASINKIAVSHGITDYIGVGYNLGYKYDFSGESTLLYSLSLGVNVNSKFGFFIEPYGDLTEFSEHTSSINGGIFYQIKDNLQADFSFGTGMNHTMNFYAVGFGWNISRNKE